MFRRKNNVVHPSNQAQAVMPNPQCTFLEDLTQFPNAAPNNGWGSYRHFSTDNESARCLTRQRQVKNKWRQDMLLMNHSTRICLMRNETIYIYVLILS